MLIRKDSRATEASSFERGAGHEFEENGIDQLPGCADESKDFVEL